MRHRAFSQQQGTYGRIVNSIGPEGEGEKGPHSDLVTHQDQFASDFRLYSPNTQEAQGGRGGGEWMAKAEEEEEKEKELELLSPPIRCRYNG